MAEYLRLHQSVGDDASQMWAERAVRAGRIMFMSKINAHRREILKSIFLVVITVLLLNVDLPYQSGLRAQEARRGGSIPYTTTLRETVYGPAGTASVAMDETFAVRSDGSLVDMLKHKKQVGTGLVDSDSSRTIYFTSGIKVEVNDFAGAKSTTISKVNLAKFQRDPSSKCINSFDGTPYRSQEIIRGDEVVAGYRTVKITSDNWTSWFALEHGCAAVKARIDWGDQGYSEKNLVELIPGEPAARLFDVPSDDREMAPSERLLGRGKDMSSCGSQRCAETLRKLDEEYWANRPKK